MGSSTGHVMTLANSIIGVSVLAMPYCFKQCGIILSVLMLLLSNAMTRLCCHFLIKSATLARRRNYEFLAFHTFGPTGKLAVELSIIGFLLGTCIAFFVVMGDLGPDILAKAFNLKHSAHIRPSVLICLALFVVLPLGLLRNVDSLSSVCTASILFYLCLVLKVVSEATPHLLAADWLDHVHLWRPAGILQCMPIFSMALACQTQVFEIYESLQDASLSRMNEVVRSAVNMCCGVYICVGFFGYVAFCTQNFSGNVLMSFSPSMATDVIKLGFVLSVAVSFPLVIFPCRASLYSLLFKRVSSWHPDLTGGPTHIPEGRFKWLTVLLVGASLIVGLLLPNIELVLGLVGSTIGTVICLLLPALMFTRLASKYSSERLVAQVIFFAAAAILVLSTYANLYAADKAGTELGVGVSLRPPELRKAPIIDMKNLEPQVVIGEGVIGGSAPKLKDMIDAVKQELQAKEQKQKKLHQEIANKPKDQDTVVRIEPPVPVEPLTSKEAKIPLKEDTLLKKVKLEIPKVENPKKELIPVKQEVPQPNLDQPKLEVQDKKAPLVLESPVKPVEQVAQDAIRKDEEEREAEDGPVVPAIPSEPVVEVKQQEQLLAKLEEHKQEQQKLLQEQKQILAELKDENIKDSNKDSVDKLAKAEQTVAESIQKVENHVEEKIVKPGDNQNVAQEKRDIKKEETNIVVAPQQQAVPLSAKMPSNANLKQPVGGGAEQNLSAIFMGLQKLTKDFSDVIKKHQEQLDGNPNAVNNGAVNPLLAKSSENKIQTREIAMQINEIKSQPDSNKPIQKSQDFAKTNTTKLSDINVKPLGALIEANQKLRQQVENLVDPVQADNKVDQSNDIVQSQQVKQSVEHTREKRDIETQVASNETCTKSQAQQTLSTSKEEEAKKISEINNNIKDAAIKNPNKPAEITLNQASEGETQMNVIEVKSSMHLSVPDVNMPSHEESQGNNDAILMVGKPMTRDLKSVTHDEDKEQN